MVNQAYDFQAMQSYRKNDTFAGSFRQASRQENFIRSFNHGQGFMPNSRLQEFESSQSSRHPYQPLESEFTKLITRHQGFMQRENDRVNPSKQYVDIT